MTKICVVTCYKDPDYVRARTLRAALKANPEYDVIIVKNSHKGVSRYFEVIRKLLAVRFRQNPDVYVLTFRGYELLPIFNLVTIGKKRIFDEFINLVEWAVYEHKKIKAGSLGARVLYRIYRGWLKRSNIILTDTVAHAKYSAKLMKLPEQKFTAVPVSTDETVFKPQKNVPKKKNFQVFYYGNMLPLHGLQYVIDAAVLLRNNADINFFLVGGDEKVVAQIEAAKAKGARIIHKKWLPFDQLPIAAAESAVCLGGPFGGTLQSNMVTTGKTYQFLALGMPTIIGKTNEKIPMTDLQSCLMVPQANAKALADKIIWAQKHVKDLPKIGQEGRKVYEQYYSNRVIADTMRTIINQL
jgi:glycosyltransferase involved in cell wall biosynthesis